MDVITSAIGYFLTFAKFDGYRKYGAGVASVLTGLSLLVLAFAGDSHGSVKEGVAAIILGIYAIGDAGKQDKQIAATKAAAVISLAVAPKDPTVSVGGIDKAAITAAVAVVTAPGNKLGA